MKTLYILRYILLLTVVTISSQQSFGINEWYDEPCELPAGFTTIDEIKGPVSKCTLHIRCAAPNKQTVQWGLMWNMKDALNYYKATLTFMPKDRHGDIYYNPVGIEVIEMIDGQQQSVYQGEIIDGIDTDGRFNSIKILYEERQARLFVGNEMQREISRVPFDPDGGDVLFFSNAQVRCQRLQCSYDRLPERPASPFKDMDQLAEYLETATSPIEGVWEYMDRNIKQEKAELGGIYKLAIVKNGDDYDILYLKGAKINSDEWCAMRLKGKLIPTIFRGNYDMIWYDADGNEWSEDVSAQLSEDGAILSLNFPLLDSQIRLRALK